MSHTFSITQLLSKVVFGVPLLLEKGTDRLLDTAQGPTLARLPEPTDITPISVIDNILKPAGTDAARMKVALIREIRKASNDATCLIVDADRLPQEWPLQTYAERWGNQKYPDLSHQEKLDVVQRFKKLLYTYCADETTRAVFQKHTTPEAILELMRVSKNYDPTQDGNLQVNSAFLKAVPIRTEYWNGDGLSTQTIWLNLIGLSADDEPITRFISRAFAEMLAPNHTVTGKMFAIVHEATHAGINRQRMDGMFAQHMEQNPFVQNIPEMLMEKFYRNERKRTEESACDTTGINAALNIRGHQYALPYAKLFLFYRFREAFTSGAHGHFTAPALSSLIEKHDPRFGKFTQEIAPLTPLQIFTGVREAHEIIKRRSMQKADFLDASFAAQSAPARALLRTTHILQENILRRKI